MGSFGIDLGTTNSVIAQLVDGVPQAIPIAGTPVLPSIVLYTEDGRVVVGREARNLALLHPDRVVRSVKRHMGEPARIELGGRSVTPEQVSAEILRALCEGAKAETGVEVREVVITVPAYFNDAQRRATLAAGELAGLRVLRLLNEPTSASLVYDRVGELADTGELMLVYDLGGGTFDVSVLEVFGDVREVRATAGNTRLGGDDFDERLVELFVAELRERGAGELDAAAMARLRRAAEETKIGLSSEVEVAVREEFIAKAGETPLHLDMVVSRRSFEAAIEELLESTIQLARRAIDDAKLEPGERIARICLVGGSTRIPMVRRLLAEAFDADIHEEIDVDLAVGLGAAISCGMLSGVDTARILVDVTAHTLGLRAIGDEDERSLTEPDTFVPVLRRNTALPAERSEELYTYCDNQRFVRVAVFQGERRRCSENVEVGGFMFELDESTPANTPVRFRFAYDLDGIVRVTASHRGAEQTVALQLPDASATAHEHGASEELDNPLLRRATRLLDTLGERERARLSALIERWRSSPSRRADVEDELLDMFLEIEAQER